MVITKQIVTFKQIICMLISYRISKKNNHEKLSRLWLFGVAEELDFDHVRRKRN